MNKPNPNINSTKQEVVSITYEEIGLFPRSFSRVFDRFLKQIFSDVENLVIQEYRFYRYLFLTTLKCLFILFFVPFLVNFVCKNYLIRPLTEYFWNTKQTEIFLNSYQQKHAFAELKDFEAKLYFAGFVQLASESKNVEKLQGFSSFQDFASQNKRTPTDQEHKHVDKEESVSTLLLKNQNISESFSFGKAGTRGNQPSLTNFSSALFMQANFQSNSNLETSASFPKENFEILGKDNLKEQVLSQLTTSTAINSQQNFAVQGFSQAKSLTLENLAPEFTEVNQRKTLVSGFSSENQRRPLEQERKPDFASQSQQWPQLLQEKTKELAQKYNNQSIENITNFFADVFSLLTLFYLLYALEIQINITKSFLLEVFFGLDDSKKSLLILLTTDLLVGYHSSNLWELFFEFIFHHYGLPESQTGIFLLVATLPVLLDVLFKYLIFRHLNRSSPATVATYRAMIE